ncbi:MAG: hypothetical protein IT379_11390, partial [Deltaproteobacteria bacterium]|nr:hypothetical protein [Deltaproteobacteria bacterium]
LQIRNHRHAIARFEYLADDGTFRAVERLDYNYFVEAAGMGPGPYTFRVTDIHGHVVEDSGIPALDDADAPSVSQLAACE